MNSLVRFSVLASVFLVAACGSSDGDSGKTGGAAGGDSFGGGDSAAGSSVGGDSGGGGESGERSAAGEGGVAGQSGANDAGAPGSTIGGAGGQGNAGSAGSAGSSGGSSGAPLLTCFADVTADTSNVGLTHFEVNTAGGIVLPQGTALSGTDAQHMRIGLAAAQSPGSVLQIGVVGAAPVSGAHYMTTADLGESVNGVPNYLGFAVTAAAATSSWVADAGTVVTVAAVGPGPLANYKIVQFTFSGAHMLPSMRSNDKATGAFTLSGSCTAAIQYK